MEIQPPYCTIIFRDYNNYDQVHFSDLKIIPRDQQFVSSKFDIVFKLEPVELHPNIVDTHRFFPFLLCTSIYTFQFTPGGVHSLYEKKDWRGVQD